MPWLWRVLSLGALAFGALLGIYVAGPPLGHGLVRTLAVTATPVPLDASDPARTRLGRLRYLGGLRLEASDRRFGGLSALLWVPACQRLLAVTDTGSFVLFQPKEAGDRLVGIGAAWIAPILGADGSPPANKREADAEALARDPATGATAVWFEGRTRAQIYAGLDPCRPESLGRPATAVVTPAAMADWPLNGGPETVADGAAGVLVVAEQAGPAPGQHWALQGPGDRLARQVLVLPDSEYVPTALDRLPGRVPPAFLMLTRRFAALGGGTARVSLVTPGPGPWKPELLAELKPPLLHENFEGLAVRERGGRTFVYLVSDNNFSWLQQSLLLKFELQPAAFGG
jgi:hypothetical protein